MESEKILICEKHEDYQTPLIFTMAFSGAEHWCPFCGHNSGMMGAGNRVPATHELNTRKRIYKDVYKEYLRSHAITTASEIKYNDGWIKPHDLPQEEKDRMANIRENGWKPDVKAEDMETSINLYPEKCPITGRPFFMEIENEDGVLIPTYGGPKDSYTIPEEVESADPDDDKYVCQRYDHDEGAWVGDEGVNASMVLPELK